MFFSRTQVALRTAREKGVPNDAVRVIRLKSNVGKGLATRIVSCSSE